MAIGKEDINLDKFLSKVTYTSDTNPGQKLVISNESFLNTAAILQLVEVLNNRL